jgi:hypothetical protein
MCRFLGCTAVVILMSAIGFESAKAATQYCDVSPENCYYGGDGRYYFMAPGSPLKKAFAAGKITIPAIVERHRKERERSLQGNGPNQAR